MSVITINYRVSYHSLMKRSKADVVSAYLQLLDSIKPATKDATDAREILRKTEATLLTVPGELGLLRRWYEGSKHLIGGNDS